MLSETTKTYRYNQIFLGKKKIPCNADFLGDAMYIGERGKNYKPLDIIRPRNVTYELDIFQHFNSDIYEPRTFLSRLGFLPHPGKLFQLNN